MSTINLSKGQKVDLTKTNPGVSKNFSILHSIVTKNNYL